MQFVFSARVWCRRCACGSSRAWPSHVFLVGVCALGKGLCCFRLSGCMQVLC